MNRPLRAEALDGATAHAEIDRLEQERLAALDRYDVLDTPPEETFDRITRMARNIFDVPIATVSLIDGHRQWLKSRQGPVERQTRKCDSFCNVTIRQAAPLIVHDASEDHRFKANPLVLGAPFIRFYAGAQLWTPDNHGLGALCVIDMKPRDFDARQAALLTDLAATVMSALEAQRLTMTDSLTGILSRHGFRSEAERALSLAIRHGHPLTCITFDLDHFKAINDGYGHATGDTVLAESVRACRERLRASDIFGRIGGEEFAILLPHTDGIAALKVAEELRAAIAGVSVTGEAGGPKASASFGISGLDQPDLDLDEVLRRADTALYAAKNGGRNRCAQWRDPRGQEAAAMRRVFKAGTIAFNGGRTAIDCTVRHLSEDGANLDVITTAGLPATFKLQIAADGLSRHCTVVTKASRRLEVAFS